MSANVRAPVLAQAKSESGGDFAVQGHSGRSSIAGKVFNDLNRNGKFDGGDIGIAGVRVFLTGFDDANQSVFRSTFTDGQGNYLFADLAAGRYRLLENQPANFLNNGNTVGSAGGVLDADTIKDIVLISRTSATGYFFGDVVCPPPPCPPDQKLHSISGFVYQDCDNDGVRDAIEAGIAGVIVTLTGVVEGDIGVFFSTTTDAAGRYSFSDLKAGTYRLVETQPALFLDGKDTAGTPFGGVADARIGFDEIRNIVIPTSTVALAGTGYNFGEVNSSLAGVVYHDANDNGVKDSNENGIGGVTITLTGTNDLGQAINVTNTTAADGTYGFLRLRPGTYQIRESQPVGYDDGKDTIGNAGGNNSANDVFTQIVVDGCTVGKGYNFGERLPSQHSISGYVYCDADNDGVRDPGEEGIAGVLVAIDGILADGRSWGAAATTTDANGKYFFGGLLAGEYHIVESQPAGYDDGKDKVGSPFPAGAANDVFTVAIPTGLSATAGTEYNFGEIGPSSIAGRVYLDANKNGVIDAGDTGIAGVVITLLGDDYLGNSVSMTITTDANGNYKFDKLRPGTYRLIETQPNDRLNAVNAAGSVGGIVDGDTIRNIVLPACTNATGYFFGEKECDCPEPAKNKISGYVFEDCDNDGVRDAAEAGIAGVEVELVGRAAVGVLSILTKTDSNGFYEFANLAGDFTYEIREVTQPAAFLDGKDSAGTPFGGRADARIGFDLISGIFIPTDTVPRSGVEYNFGEVNGSISGFVYNDLDDDGVKDAGEPGIGGVTVTLTGVNDLNESITVTATTGLDGSYGFLKLRPGTYRIAESQPAGFLDGKDTAGSAGGNATVNDVISSVIVDGCTHANGYNFGERTPAKHRISGFVFEDCDNDGVFDSADEQGVAGVVVTLTGTDIDGLAVILQATTGLDGKYVFTGLNAGSYRLNETQPVMFLDGKDASGTPFGGIADPRIGFDVISNLIIANSPTALAGIDYNFGEVNNSIRGSVYHDKNDDGVRDANEQGIRGVSITLVGVNDLGETITLSTTSGADGNYAFSNLRPGTYKIVETQPADFDDGKDTLGDSGGVANPNDTFDGVILKGCTHAKGYNFGEKTKPAKHSISGFVYEDCDNDGVRDAGEKGIAGVEILLSGAAPAGGGVFAAKTTTDATGKYEFTDLPGNHTYTISEAQPSAYLDGKDSAGTPFGGSADARIGFDFISGIAIPQSTTPTAGVDYNFGEVNGSLNGVVYEDTDNDGVQDAGEAGIAGVTVTLTGTNDLAQNVSKTTTTGVNGKYAFDQLRPGEYQITETQPAGYIDGKESLGNAGGKIGDDKFTHIIVDGCTVGNGYKFGERKPAEHSLSGSVFCDEDNDGVRDAGEEGISGVRVVLNGAGVTLTATTGATGQYEFLGLKAGTYTLTEIQPMSHADGKDRPGTPFGGTADSSINADVISGIVIPESASSKAGQDYNFGEVGSSLSGYVYHDADDDGRFDANETGIAGVRIVLVGMNDANQQVNLTATTNADGYYEFSKLRPGTYHIGEHQPDGWLDGKDTLGTLGGQIAGNDTFACTILGGCEFGKDFNFGERKPAPHSLSGYVFCDADNDGNRDTADEGIAGVKVVLTGAGVTLTATTNDSGRYEFTGLRAGNYVLTEIQPNSHADGKDRAGTNFGGVADTRTDFDIIAGIVLPESLNSQSGSDYNFGEVGSSLSGFVYFDADNDGRFDAGETGIAGVRVVLVGTNDKNQAVTMTATTDATGYYEFIKLRPGTYHIGEHQPTGWLDGKDTLGSLGGSISGNDTFACTLLGGCEEGLNYNFGERRDK
jgi:protocatechuate 3,4-dioxygenase beta subunit